MIIFWWIFFVCLLIINGHKTWIYIFNNASMLNNTLKICNISIRQRKKCFDNFCFCSCRFENVDFNNANQIDEKNHKQTIHFWQIKKKQAKEKKNGFFSSSKWMTDTTEFDTINLMFLYDMIIIIFIIIIYNHHHDINYGKNTSTFIGFIIINYHCMMIIKTKIIIYRKTMSWIALLFNMIWY